MSLGKTSRTLWLVTRRYDFDFAVFQLSGRSLALARRLRICWNVRVKNPNRYRCLNFFGTEGRVFWKNSHFCCTMFIGQDFCVSFCGRGTPILTEGLVFVLGKPWEVQALQGPMRLTLQRIYDFIKV